MIINQIKIDSAIYLLATMLAGMILFIIYLIIKTIISYKESNKWRKTIVNGDSVLVSFSDRSIKGILQNDNDDGTSNIIINVNKNSLYKPHDIK